eukprot:Ihof_evm7s18 gene=Ihof_evmTU7s18
MAISDVTSRRRDAVDNPLSNSENESTYPATPLLDQCTDLQEGSRHSLSYKHFPTVPVPPVEEQAQQIRQIVTAAQRKTGEVWNAISIDWWMKWCRYVGYEDNMSMGPTNPTLGENPGPIDNSKIQGSDNYEVRRFRKSSTTIGQIKKIIAQIYNKPDNDTTRLWHLFKNSEPYRVLDCMEKSIVEVQYIEDDEIIALEEQFGGMWPVSEGVRKGLHRSVMTPHQSLNSSPYNGQSGLLYTFGVCGLLNLGNTCFMNSALQCLSNTSPLTDYILEGKANTEINDKNPLGMRGEIATQYCMLVSQLWAGKDRSIAPRAFKHKLGSYQPRFSGYQQQDAQELLSFLLDGLHEDLNRVKQKPYIEMPDSDDHPDEYKLAEISWDYHKKRNDSIIVDLFQGQFKSTLRSITFDPFMYLSLPLPCKQKSIPIYFAPINGAWVKYNILVDDHAPVSQLKTILSEKCSVPPNKLLLGDVFAHKLYKEYSPKDTVGDIKDSNVIIAYEVATLDPVSEDWAVLRVLHRSERQEFNCNYSTASWQNTGVPIVVSVKRKETTLCALQQAVYNAVRNICPYKVPQSTTKSDLSSIPNGDNIVLSEDKGEQISSTANKIPLLKVTPDSNRQSVSDIDECSLASHIYISFRKERYSPQLPMKIKTPNKADDEPLDFSGHTTVDAYWTKYDLSLAHFMESDCRSLDWVMSDPTNITPNHCKAASVSLYDCLNLFTRQEELGNEDLWYCPNCKNHQHATKKFDLWKLPKILVIHLKRFCDFRWYRQKLDTYVDFPLEGLDLTKYVTRNSANVLYDLHAVSNHTGELGRGHYTSCAKNKVDNSWYNFDDSITYKIPEKDIK